MIFRSIFYFPKPQEGAWVGGKLMEMEPKIDDQQETKTIGCLINWDWV